MNALFSIVFFIYLYFQYQLFGYVFLHWTGYENNKRNSILLGFFFTFFLLWITGFLNQLLHSSWIFYFYSSLIWLIVIDLFCLFFLFKRHLFLECFQIQDLRTFIKNNWLGMVFVFVFTVFSISNQLPFLEMNYDDAYYIGKMVNLVQSPEIMNEDYFNGTLLASNQIDLARIVNTYELSYSYFATLFHIYIPYFCRVTMTIHNYSLFYLAYSSLASIFLKKNYTQFSLIPFFVFIIPYGFLQKGIDINHFSFQIYDMWQFQTAMFYGSSVVRTMAFPILFYFSYPLLKKIELKKIIILGVISISFVSFSTIFIQQFIIFLILIIFLKGLNFIYYSLKLKRRKLGLEGSLYIVISVFFFIFFNCIFDKIGLVSGENVEIYQSINNFYNEWIKQDFILHYLPILVFGFFVFNKILSQKLFLLFVLLLYIICISPIFWRFLINTCFGYDFVIFRTFSSIQMLIIFSAFLFVPYLCQNLKFGKNLEILQSFFMIGAMLIVFAVNYNKFFDYTYLGSGISSEGWRFDRVFDINTKMVPQTAYEIGEYLNGIPYGNYNVYSDNFIYDKDIKFDHTVLSAVSNRIQIRSRGGMPQLEESEMILIDQFLRGDLNYYESAMEILKNKNIDFLIVNEKNVSDYLVAQGEALIETFNNDYRPVSLFLINEEGE